MTSNSNNTFLKNTYQVGNSVFNSYEEALCYLNKEKNYTTNATEIIINTEYYY